MNSNNFYLFSFFTLFSPLILIHVSQGSSNPYEFYQTCGNTYSCANITGLSYPFRNINDPPYCGYPGFELSCNQDSTTTMIINKIKYRILNIQPTTQTIRIVREDIMESTCPVDLVNTTLDHSLFDFATSYTNFTVLYDCPDSDNVHDMYVIGCKDSKYDSVYVLLGAHGPGKCNASVIVPVVQLSGNALGSLSSTDNLSQVLQEGFDIRWKMDSKACSECTDTKGRCGYDGYSNQQTCFCPGPPYESVACSVAAFGDSPPLPITRPPPAEYSEVAATSGGILSLKNQQS